MKKLRWQLLIVTLALGAIAVLLLGRQPVIQAVVQQPEEGGVYTEGIVGKLERLNPLLADSNSADRAVNRLIFSSLVRYDSRGLPQLDLAESSGISRDGTIYNFSLRPDAFWHDGEPVTSGDVIFTIDLLRAPDIPAPESLRDFWEQIEVKGLDEKTLQFILPEPFAPFLDYLTFGVLPEHIWRTVSPELLVDSPINLQPIGSGPYRFDNLLVEEGQITGVVLSAFQDYYFHRPFIDQIVFRHYPDAQAAMDAYERGEVLGIGQITTGVLDQALAEPNLNIYSSRLPELTLVYLNLDNPQVAFFQENEVRKALMLALNRQWMIDQIHGGQAILADGPIFPGTWAYYEGIERYGYDPDQAIALLRSAGYTIPAEGGSVRQKEDLSLSFTLVYAENDRHARLAEALQRYWRLIGVEVTLEGVPFEEMVRENLVPRSYQAILIDMNLADSPDPDPYPFWHQAQISGGQNYAKWDDRPTSEYLEQARVTVDLEERARLYRNFQARFSNSLPALPLYYPVYTYAVDNQVQGVQVGPLFDATDRFATVIDWFMLARRPVEAEITPTPTP